MRQWNKETIEEQLRIHKKQNKDVRYNYMCEQFNVVWYCWELEKYTLQKEKEIERLNNKYNKALELLANFNMPCEMVQNKIPDEYCEENCDVDDETYKKCWDKYIEIELKEGK